MIFDRHVKNVGLRDWGIKRSVEVHGVVEILKIALVETK